MRTEIILDVPLVQHLIVDAAFTILMALFDGPMTPWPGHAPMFSQSLLIIDVNLSAFTFGKYTPKSILN